MYSAASERTVRAARAAEVVTDGAAHKVRYEQRVAGGSRAVGTSAVTARTARARTARRTHHATPAPPSGGSATNLPARAARCGAARYPSKT